MTFIPATSNNVSSLNSTSSTLTASSEYLGTSEDVSRYSSIIVTTTSNVDSASLGVKFELSMDNTNWDVIEAFTYSSELPFVTRTIKVVGQYFRVRYTNGSTNQTTFRLQTRFESSSVEEKKRDIPVDGFGRVRTSEPYTLLTNNHITGKNTTIVYEDITGSATSVYDSDKSHVLMNTTGVGTVIRRSRRRAIYQPGKSLLVYITGVLNSGTNASTVTTKIGYYDEDDGYYFQHVNGVSSIVERSSVSGSVVETTVNQSSWNMNDMTGATNNNFIFDDTKTLIFWFNLEWLGVGFVQSGLVIDGKQIECHRFRHSNLLDNVYISTASLQPTYEIISTGGSGSMKSICYTVLSEGGFRPHGKHFSANMGTSTQDINSIEPLIVLRIVSGSKVNVKLREASVISTSGANALIEVWKFSDITAGTILNNTTFISANTDSDVEYNTAATTITTTNGVLVSSSYISNNTDQIDFKIKENGIMSTSAGVSDLLAICASSLGAGENFAASVTWTESI